MQRGPLQKADMNRSSAAVPSCVPTWNYHRFHLIYPFSYSAVPFNGFEGCLSQETARLHCPYWTITALHYIELQYTTLHYITLYYVTLHSVPFELQIRAKKEKKKGKLLYIHIIYTKYEIFTWAFNSEIKKNTNRSCRTTTTTTTTEQQMQKGIQILKLCHSLNVITDTDDTGCYVFTYIHTNWI